MTFEKSEISADSGISNTQYKYFKNQNKNLFYLLNNQLDYVLAHFFTESEIIKHNIDKFPIKLLIKPIIKKFSYYNINK